MCTLITSATSVCISWYVHFVSVLLPLTPYFLPVRRSLEFYDACLYEAVMACDSDRVLAGGELIVRIPRDAYKDYPSTIVGSECGQWKE